MSTLSVSLPIAFPIADFIASLSALVFAMVLHFVADLCGLRPRLFVLPSCGVAPQGLSITFREHAFQGSQWQSLSRRSGVTRLRCLSHIAHNSLGGKVHICGRCTAPPPDGISRGWALARWPLEAGRQSATVTKKHHANQVAFPPSRASRLSTNRFQCFKHMLRR